MTDTQKSKRVLTNTTSYFTNLTELYGYAVIWRSETQTRGPPHYHKQWINRDEQNPPRPTVIRLKMGCCVSPTYLSLSLLLDSSITCNTDTYTDDIVTKTNSHHMIPNMNWSNRPCYEEKQQPPLKRANHESSMHVAVFDNPSDFLLHNGEGKSCADGFSCPICNRHLSGESKHRGQTSRQVATDDFIQIVDMIVRMKI